MTKAEERNLRIFEKYNPKNAVIRCPYGWSDIRLFLDCYAKAAVNLYGVIPIQEFVSIFNSHADINLTAKKAFELLLPLVLKSKDYCFYKDYIVHYWMIDDFTDVDDLIYSIDKDKPRFIPLKDDFLKYVDPYYEDKTQEQVWKKLKLFTDKEWESNYKGILFFYDLKEASLFCIGVKFIGELLEKYGLEFTSEKRAQTFFKLYMEAKNNTRIWDNKGHTPYELFEFFGRGQDDAQDTQPKGVVINQAKKIGQNDPCPCGSGKKYKKCCRLTEEARTSQLSYSEGVLFYQIWHRLLAYVNEKKNVTGEYISPKFPSEASEESNYKIREELWKNPEIIDEYIKEKTPDEEEEGILLKWRKNHIKGHFVICNHTPEYAVLIKASKKGDVLYGVKGLSKPLSVMVQKSTPVMCETVLLPFKDKIVYDTYFNTQQIDFLDGAKDMYKEMYEKALKNGIITKI